MSQRVQDDDEESSESNTADSLSSSEPSESSSSSSSSDDQSSSSTSDVVDDDENSNSSDNYESSNGEEEESLSLPGTAEVSSDEEDAAEVSSNSAASASVSSASEPTESSGDSDNSDDPSGQSSAGDEKAAASKHSEDASESQSEVSEPTSDSSTVRTEIPTAPAPTRKAAISSKNSKSGDHSGSSEEQQSIEEATSSSEVQDASEGSEDNSGEDEGSEDEDQSSDVEQTESDNSDETSDSETVATEVASLSPQKAQPNVTPSIMSGADAESSHSESSPNPQQTTVALPRDADPKVSVTKTKSKRKPSAEKSNNVETVQSVRVPESKASRAIKPESLAMSERTGTAEKESGVSPIDDGFFNRSFARQKSDHASITPSLEEQFVVSPTKSTITPLSSHLKDHQAAAKAEVSHQNLLDRIELKSLGDMSELTNDTTVKRLAGTAVGGEADNVSNLESIEEDVAVEEDFEEPPNDSERQQNIRSLSRKSLQTDATSTLAEGPGDVNMLNLAFDRDGAVVFDLETDPQRGDMEKPSTSNAPSVEHEEPREQAVTDRRTNQKRQKSSFLRFVTRGLSSAVRPSFRQKSVDGKTKQESTFLDTGLQTVNLKSRASAPKADRPIDEVAEEDAGEDSDEEGIMAPQRLPSFDFETSSVRDDPSESGESRAASDKIKRPENELRVDAAQPKTRSGRRRLRRTKSGDSVDLFRAESFNSSDGDVSSNKSKKKLFGFFRRGKVMKNYSSFDGDSESSTGNLIPPQDPFSRNAIPGRGVTEMFGSPFEHAGDFDVKNAPDADVHDFFNNSFQKQNQPVFFDDFASGYPKDRKSDSEKKCGQKTPLEDAHTELSPTFEDEVNEIVQHYDQSEDETESDVVESGEESSASAVAEDNWDSEESHSRVSEDQREATEVSEEVGDNELEDTSGSDVVGESEEAESEEETESGSVDDGSEEEGDSGSEEDIANESETTSESAQSEDSVDDDEISDRDEDAESNEGSELHDEVSDDGLVEFVGISDLVSVSTEISGSAAIGANTGPGAPNGFDFSDGPVDELVEENLFSGFDFSTGIPENDSRVGNVDSSDDNASVESAAEKSSNGGASEFIPVTNADDEDEQETESKRRPLRATHSSISFVTAESETSHAERSYDPEKPEADAAPSYVTPSPVIEPASFRSRESKASSADSSSNYKKKGRLARFGMSLMNKAVSPKTSESDFKKEEYEGGSIVMQNNTYAYETAKNSSVNKKTDGHGSPIRNLAARARRRLSGKTALEDLSDGDEVATELNKTPIQGERSDTAYLVEELLDSNVVECIVSASADDASVPNESHRDVMADVRGGPNESIGFDEDGISEALFEESADLSGDYTYSREALDITSPDEGYRQKANVMAAAEESDSILAGYAESDSMLTGYADEPLANDPADGVAARNSESAKFPNRHGKPQVFSFWSKKSAERPKDITKVELQSAVIAQASTTNVNELPRNKRRAAYGLGQFRSDVKMADDDDSAYKMESGEFKAGDHPFEQAKVKPRNGELQWLPWSKGRKQGKNTTAAGHFDKSDVKDKPHSRKTSKATIYLRGEKTAPVESASIPEIENGDSAPKDYGMSLSRHKPKRTSAGECWCRWFVVILLAMVGVAAGIGVAIFLTRDSGDDDKAQASSATPVDAPPTTSSPTIAPGPTSSPIQNQDTFELLCSVTTNCLPLLDGESPQGKAFEWLVDLSLNPDFDEYTAERKIARFALATLFYSTEGEAWEQNTNWLSTADECDWFTTRQQSSCLNGELVALELDNNNVQGELPIEISLLTSLTSLSLRNPANSLTLIQGSFPSSLGALSALTALTISGNKIAGGIPQDIGKLSRLETLDLSSNELSGDIPFTFNALSKLTFLSLRQNRLTGGVPSDLLRSATRLVQLHLDGNSFTSVPRELKALNNLRVLNLANNELGFVPTGLFELTNLKSLDMSENSFGGTIPTQIGLMHGLTKLSLASNEFRGFIPTELGNLLNLSEILDLSRNRIAGSIPNQLGQLLRLQTLYLNSNELTGTIPSELVRLNEIKVVQFDDNRMAGQIPLVLCLAYNNRNVVAYADCSELSGTDCITFCCTAPGDCRCQFESTDFQRCYVN